MMFSHIDWHFSACPLTSLRVAKRVGAYILPSSQSHVFQNQLSCQIQELFSKDFRSSLSFSAEKESLLLSWCWVLLHWLPYWILILWTVPLICLAICSSSSSKSLLAAHDMLIIDAGLCNSQFQNHPSPPPPGQPPGIWLGLNSIQWGIWPKTRPAQRGIWLWIKKSVSVRKQKDFAILWFSTCTEFTGHFSCQFHVGFSVVVLYSYIVEYAFVLSVERRQAEQEICSGWKFCGTCLQR